LVSAVVGGGGGRLRAVEEGRDAGAVAHQVVGVAVALVEHVVLRVVGAAQAVQPIIGVVDGAAGRRGLRLRGRGNGQRVIERRGHQSGRAAVVGADADK